MSWKRWKLGVLIALLLSAFVAGAAWEDGASWRTLLKVFCAACLTHFGAFIKQHPVEDVRFNGNTEFAQKETKATK